MHQSQPKFRIIRKQLAKTAQDSVGGRCDIWSSSVHDNLVTDQLAMCIEDRSLDFKLNQLIRMKLPQERTKDISPSLPCNGWENIWLEKLKVVPAGEACLHFHMGNDKVEGKKLKQFTSCKLDFVILHLKDWSAHECAVNLNNYLFSSQPAKHYSYYPHANSKLYPLLAIWFYISKNVEPFSSSMHVSNENWSECLFIIFFLLEKLNKPTGYFKALVYVFYFQEGRDLTGDNLFLMQPEPCFFSRHNIPPLSSQLTCMKECRRHQVVLPVLKRFLANKDWPFGGANWYTRILNNNFPLGLFLKWITI